MRLKALWFALALSAFSGQALCGDASLLSFMNGNRLLEECESPGPSGVCIGYIEGVVDEVLNLQAYSRQMHETDPNIQLLFSTAPCVKKDMIARQMIDIVLQYLRNHPEMRHEIAAALVYSAISQALPCP